MKQKNNTATITLYSCATEQKIQMGKKEKAKRSADTSMVHKRAFTV